MKYLLLFGLLFFSPQFSQVSAAQGIVAGVNEDLPRFSELSPGLFRGGRPSEAGLRKLAALGITTIINLENDERVVEAESRIAAELGMQVLKFPMEWISTPNDSDVNQILELMRTRGATKIYVHCQHGKDRTGVIVALHRVLTEGLDANAAYDEMLSFGFSRFLFKLENYYWKRAKRQAYSL